MNRREFINSLRLAAPALLLPRSALGQWNSRDCGWGLSTSPGCGASGLVFPGDLMSWDVAGGIRPLYRAIYTASFSTPQPAVRVVPVDSAGVAGAAVDINFVNGGIDVASIIAAQGSTGSFPRNMLVTHQLHVTRVYDQSGNNRHFDQLVALAAMPVLGLFDGIPHICYFGGRTIVSPVAPKLCDQFVAVNAQVYGAGSDTSTYTKQALFYTSSTSDLFGIGVLPYGTSSVGPPTGTAPLCTEWRVFNNATLSAGQALGIKGSNNPVPVSMASGTTGELEIAVNDEIYSTGASPFFPFIGNSGTALTIGGGDGAGFFSGYCDDVLFINTYQTPTTSALVRSQLRQLRGYSNNNSINIVMEGNSSQSGTYAIAPYIAGVNQGTESFGLMQHYLRSVSTRFCNIATPGATVNDCKNNRLTYVQNLYRAGSSKNILVLQAVPAVASEVAAYAAALHALGQNWYMVFVGIANPTGDPATTALNAAVSALANASPTPGSGFSFVSGLQKTTWDEALLTYTTSQLFAWDGVHVSCVGAFFMAADSLPGIQAVVMA